MAPLLVCSLAATTIIIERLWALRRARVLPASLLQILDRWLASGSVNPDDLAALPLHSPLGRIVAAGLACRGRGRDILRERVEDIGRHVTHELERFLSPLGTIATISPLLGLLGTVGGMIKIFQVVSTPGNNDFTALSQGIAEALITTAAGLTIAIPCVIFYRFFDAKVDQLVMQIEQETLQLVDLLDTRSDEEQRI